MPLPSPLGLLPPCKYGCKAGLLFSCFYLSHPERFTNQSLSSSAEHLTVLESARKLVNFEVAFCPKGAGKTDRVTNQPTTCSLNAIFVHLGTQELSLSGDSERALDLESKGGGFGSASVP